MKSGVSNSLNRLVESSIDCPYCGETIEVLLDPTDVDLQYIEDCQVCCRPITFLVSENGNDELIVSVFNEDETI